MAGNFSRGTAYLTRIVYLLLSRPNIYKMCVFSLEWADNWAKTRVGIERRLDQLLPPLYCVLPLCGNCSVTPYVRV